MARTFTFVTIAFLMSGGLSASALAQEADASLKSAEELQQMFEAQKTRGLVIVPSSGGEVMADDTDGTSISVAPSATDDGEASAATAYASAGDDAEINIRIAFDFDSALLREDQRPKLTTLCEAINNMEGQVFRIVGHTDAAGTESYNEQLSLLRAEEVKRYMVGTCEIAGDRLVAIGVGEAYPENEADPLADENRRVEFQLIS
ncbi:OmpA family protein [Tropicimonas sp.]|uniref:OmpA family protein n=1 Tax=Tropicimonas sp. TaxID=2067044 RepID=UPI003A84F735